MNKESGDSSSRDFSSRDYWEKRYESGRNSGAGSYGRLAQFKAHFLNSFFSLNAVSSAVELGCGDGNQLSLLKIEKYTGIDVSRAAVEKCRGMFSDRPNFNFMTERQGMRVPLHDVALSLDVVFHLVEDAVFAKYINRLFKLSTRFVVIYSSNYDGHWSSVHVRHRNFTSFITGRYPSWTLACSVPNIFPYDSADVNNTSFSDFFIFRRGGEKCMVEIPSSSPEVSIPASPTL